MATLVLTKFRQKGGDQELSQTSDRMNFSVTDGRKKMCTTVDREL
jgi:hypothetical protein